MFNTRSRNTPRDASRRDEGLAMLDVLLGMAIFALIVVIAVIGSLQFRQRAYQTAVTADTKRMGEALMVGDLYAPEGQTQQASFTNAEGQTESVSISMAAAEKLNAVRDVTDPVDATRMTLYKGNELVRWSVNNLDQFSFCIEHRSPNGTPDAFAAYDSERGGIVATGRPGGCSDYKDLHDYNPAPVTPAVPTTPPPTTPPIAPEPTTPPTIPTTPPTNTDPPTPPACTTATNYDGMQPGTSVDTITFPGTSTTAKMTFAPGPNSDISGSGTINQIAGGGTKYVRTNMNTPLRSGRYVDVTVKFNSPVENLQMKVHDIDKSRSGQTVQWVDEVAIMTSGFTTSARGQNVGGAGTSASPYLNDVWGDNPISSGMGDVVMKWAAPVSQVTIRFRSGADGTSQNQQVGVGALSFTTC